MNKIIITFGAMSMLEEHAKNPIRHMAKSVGRNQWEIEVDNEVLEMLEQSKEPGENYSQVIIRLFRRKDV